MEVKEEEEEEARLICFKRERGKTAFNAIFEHFKSLTIFETSFIFFMRGGRNDIEKAEEEEEEEEGRSMRKRLRRWRRRKRMRRRKSKNSRSFFNANKKKNKLSLRSWGQ